MSNEQTYDPVYLHTRREAIVIIGLWLFALLWTVPYCYFNGFHTVSDGGEIETMWGIPSWVFWGIAVPWLVCDVIAIGLCLFFIKQDDLGEAHEGADIAEDQQRLHQAEGRG
ncbi:MAG: hypothetical protein DWQ34_02545 [Planctomycetota bacterium]|nr:MAG: hypothetical protein DWQ29_18365 [Planctomycetota bacterium]REJ97222.1 MAG: hypothetical protein DWQ34_02545 [Planctomycetota bacterium]REK30328.1 MAG: hypothetical protein DWQ41_02215 [Planctomycetota bacterium]REK31521.1 MAG: hypothetical protein DWQ45_19545 [Planctomycetota bacterium]